MFGAFGRTEGEEPLKKMGLVRGRCAQEYLHKLLSDMECEARCKLRDQPKVFDPEHLKDLLVHDQGRTDCGKSQLPGSTRSLVLAMPDSTCT